MENLVDFEYEYEKIKERSEIMAYPSQEIVVGFIQPVSRDADGEVCTFAARTKTAQRFCRACSQTYGCVHAIKRADDDLANEFWHTHRRQMGQGLESFDRAILNITLAMEDDLCY